MKRVPYIAVAVCLLLSVAACYHATIETGLEPSMTTIDQQWASAWVYGLVPPKLVETASKCTNGVARVQTQLSFLNQLVGFLTLGIYTPMNIKVTCAAGGSASADDASSVEIGAGASLQQKQQALTEAARLARANGGSALFVVKE